MTMPASLSPAGTDLRRRFNFGLAVWVALAALLALFLASPLDQTNLHPVILAFHKDLKAALVLLSPYLLVGALGAGVGLAELSSTFSEYPREAIATQWGQYLMWLNAIAAAGAFFIARQYAPAEVNIFILILTVGVGFQALIRTKFTLAKQFGGEGQEDLSLNLGWLYDQFQSLCKKQIDLELMTYRRTQVDRLLARYSTVQELYQTALYTIKARATLTPDEEMTKLTELEKIIDPKVPPEVARMELGLLILELGGVAYVDLLVRARDSAPTPYAGGAEGAAPVSFDAASPAPQRKAVSTDVLVKQLVDLPLEDLTALAQGLLKGHDGAEWVKQAAAPTQGITGARQKAPIAYYLVEHAGAETVAEALSKRG
jgi:hypothetical protein